MHDPFPFSCPPALAKAVQPFADYYGLQTLPVHIHEILFSALTYYFIGAVVSPVLSRAFIPKQYREFAPRTRLNWDIHVVSFFQSVTISALALWVMWTDQNPERVAMTHNPEGWKERIFGHTGAEGMIQAFATGYFVWDLWISLRYVHVFGLGMLAHAISALTVYALGFRPFVNYYAPIFILYELSSPFLNIHWFCDKLSLTGSSIQLYNGICLILTFAGCRLVWGTYQSVRVFYDIYTAWAATADPTSPTEPLGSDLGIADRLRYVTGPGAQHVPLWLPAAYLTANMVLNTLNWVWFSKMIATIRARFEPPLGTKKVEKNGDGKRHRRSSSVPVVIQGTDIDTDEEGMTTETEVMRGVDNRGHKSVEVERVEVVKRRGGRKA